MSNECYGVQNTTTGLWIIAVSDNGTYSWGNAENAVCFAPGRPIRRPH